MTSDVARDNASVVTSDDAWVEEFNELKPVFISYRPYADTTYNAGGRILVFGDEAPVSLLGDIACVRYECGNADGVNTDTRAYFILVYTRNGKWHEIGRTEEIQVWPESYDFTLVGSAHAKGKLTIDTNWGIRSLTLKCKVSDIRRASEMNVRYENPHAVVSPSFNI